MVNSNTKSPQQVTVIGAGPAGLTAAYELCQREGYSISVFEKDSVVGGISRTVEADGWRFDIGGHRFFTKVQRVEELWHEILPAEDFLLRPRMSRIFYQGKFYDYPLKGFNALKNLGLIEAIRCVMSYIYVKIRPPKDQSTFEGWVAARFGWRLYRIFFKTYTEKVWGVPASEIQSDWAAQRIKNLSLGKAILNALLPSKNQKEITSLIEEFEYPKYGPGMMWEACAEKVSEKGAKIVLQSEVTGLKRDGDRVVQATVSGESGHETLETDSIISSMPLNELVFIFDPPPPAEVLDAANALHHRDFLTVALVVPEEFAFPDNWIYIHSPEVSVGRVQNYGSWSPFLIKDGRTCLGLEYFVTFNDAMWNMPDDQLIQLASHELHALQLINSTSDIEQGFVVRMPKAYPVYDQGYAKNVETIRQWIERNAVNVYPAGRNGMHKYNNQDHSMMTALLSAENIADGQNHDIWSVNVEEEYHEEGQSEGTGRAAPITS